MRFLVFLLTVISFFTFAEQVLSPDEHDPKKVHPSASQLSLRDTALGDYVLSNAGKFPRSGEEWRELLDAACGSSNSFIIPFSGAPKYTDLDEFRNVYVSPANDLGLGLIKREDGNYDAEFISRNKANPKEPDFGVIEGLGTPEARHRFVDRRDCVTCHVGGELLGYAGPWSTSLMRANPGKTFLPEGETEKNPQVNLQFHRTFLKRLAEKHPKYAVIRDRLSPEAMDKASIQALYHPDKSNRVDGADVFADADRIEHALAAFNDVTLLHEVIGNMDVADARKTIRILVGAICHKSPTKSTGAASSIIAANGVALNADKPFLLTPLNFPHMTGMPSANLFLDEAAILKLNAEKKAKRIRNTHPDQSPLNPDVFKIDSSPLGGALGTYRARAMHAEPDLNPIDAYRRSLCLDEALMVNFCKSSEYNELLKSPKLPSRYDFQAAIEKWRKSGTGVGGRTGEKKSCLDCHGPGKAYTEFPFDVGSIAAWRGASAKAEHKPNSPFVKLAQSVAKMLATDKMPPLPYSSQLSVEQTKTLQQYLEGLVDSSREK